MNTPILQSEVGNELAMREDCDFALMWNYLMEKKACLVSLRSCKTKNVDVSEVAKR